MVFTYREMFPRPPGRRIPFCVKSLFLTFLCVLSLYCIRPRQDVLVAVGNRTLLVSDFAARFESTGQKLGLPDNGQVREKMLQNMIDEELLIVEAVRRGYRKDRAGRHESERLNIQELLNAYTERYVTNRIRIREDDLKTTYIRLNTKVKARHLYAASRAKADSLISLLNGGATFEALAKGSFRDPRLRDTGGSLGAFTADEMDPAFEDAAFSLDIGQISEPIRTAQGYSILQVEGRTVKPLLTESEYAKSRSKLASYCRVRMGKRAARAHADSLRRSLHVSFNRPAVTELLKRILVKTGLPSWSPADGLVSADDEKTGLRELVRSDLGVWTVRTFQEHAAFTSGEQVRWIRDRESLEDFIAGLIVRSAMLTKAKHARLDRSDAHRTAVQRRMDDYLLARMEGEISGGVVIPEDTLRAAFNLEMQRYAIPPKIRLREIALDDRPEAGRIGILLQRGESFEKLARERSVRVWSAAQNGDIGEFAYSELGRHAERLFPLEAGRWTGPIAMDDGHFAFFQCVGKSRERIPDFQEARSGVLRGLMPAWKRKARQEALDSIRRRVRVVIDAQKLNSIRLKTVSTRSDQAESRL
jgi:parvulin-like peptidyl-prolyl isomerase